MKISTDDPKLTAYALGEMNEAECTEFEPQLERSLELRAAVEEIRLAAAALQSEFASEGKTTPGVAVSEVLAQAAEADKMVPFPRRAVAFTAAVTALAACVVGLLAWQFWSSHTYLNLGAAASPGRIDGPGAQMSSKNGSHAPSALYDINRQYYGPSELESTRLGSDVDLGLRSSSPIEPVRFAYDYPAHDAKRADASGRFHFSVSYQQNF